MISIIFYYYFVNILSLSSNSQKESIGTSKKIIFKTSQPSLFEMKATAVSNNRTLHLVAIVGYLREEQGSSNFDPFC